MLDFNEELAKFQPCADLEEAEEYIWERIRRDQEE